MNKGASAGQMDHADHGEAIGNTFHVSTYIYIYVISLLFIYLNIFMLQMLIQYEYIDNFIIVLYTLSLSIYANIVHIYIYICRICIYSCVYTSASMYNLYISHTHIIINIHCVHQMSISLHII